MRGDETRLPVLVDEPDGSHSEGCVRPGSQRRRPHCTVYQSVSRMELWSLRRPQVVEELRARVDARHQQPVARAGAGDV